ncbi:MAG: RAMP superfamily CRISPR-associated protein [Candidatus Methanomethyliaceae archaeon]
MNAQWLNPRGITERIVAHGTLVLQTPTHLGNGDADGPLDMPLLLDPLEGRALLTGTSIAGAMRSYLRTQDARKADLLFGRQENSDGNSNSYQSPLIVDDALGERPKVELRDGVALDPRRRTVEADKKFDIELLEAGTEFPLHFELLVLKEYADELRKAFALALHGLETGAVRLGKRKRRGFGRCTVREWTVHRYQVDTPQGMIAWLESKPPCEVKGPIASILGLAPQPGTEPGICSLHGTFRLDGSLMIRSGFAKTDDADFVHLTSNRDGRNLPVLSGTSLAGALRARALVIANTLGKDGKQVTDNLFGSRRNNETEHEKLTASRFWTEEAVIKNGLNLVCSRVKIDRFTGGSYPGALFTEEPVFGKLKDMTFVEISVKLESPSDSEVGLLLLLLKDLWTGDLPLGGEIGVGRGRLRGEKAILSYDEKSWTFFQNGDVLQVEGDTAMLESYVKAFAEGQI